MNKIKNKIETLLLAQTNLDDLIPQAYEYIIERLLKVGALDVWVTPIVMKKSRPAHELSVLFSPFLKSKISEILFEETTTLGIRFSKIERESLERKIKSVATPWGKIRVKLGFFKGQLVTASPEYEDCKRISEAKRVAFKKVYTAAQSQIDKSIHLGIQ